MTNNKFHEINDGGTTFVAVASDAHVGEKNNDTLKAVAHAMDAFYQLAPRLDAVIFGGDVSDNGYKHEYCDFMTTVKAKIKPQTKMAIIMGNHEWYRHGWGCNIFANEFTKNYQSYFKRYTGFGVENDTVVNGIHLLSVSPDNERDYYISRENFLEKHIEKAAKEDKNKPIFLICHKPVKYTINTSGEDPTEPPEDVAAGWSDKFLEFLQKYPQIIYVSGHSHSPLNIPKTIFDNGYTCINSGVVKGPASTALLFSISPINGVNIYRLNLSEDEFIGETWNVPIRTN